jgi:hydrogenase nickel incorporation protein HypA/HybF
MHEWALADAIVAAVSSELSKSGALGVREVVVLLGELQAADRQILAFALRSVSQGTRIHPDAFRLETEPAAFACGSCPKEWGLDAGLTVEEREAVHLLPESAHAFLRCPACGSADFSIARGRGVTVSSIQWEGLP